jgi:hypothetical protein
LYGTSILTVRSRNASISSLFWSLLVLGLVRVPDDHLVDVRLGELLRLDHVLLARAEQVVEERDVELEHLDELDDAAVRDVELAVEVEGPGVAVRAVLRDLAVVDVAGELGGVLVLLVLGLERADADAVLLARSACDGPHVVEDLHPVAVVALASACRSRSARSAQVESSLSLYEQRVFSLR